MHRQEIVFREATGADACEVITFFNQIGSESEFLTMDETGFQGTASDLAKALESGRETPNNLCLVAVLGNRIIGMINIKADWHERVNHIGDIFIAVLKDFWGHQIGHILLEEAIDWAQHSGIIRRLELTVQARNEKAVHLYQKFGFEREGIKKRGAKTKNGEFLDVYLMGRLIDDVRE